MDTVISKSSILLESILTWPKYFLNKSVVIDSAGLTEKLYTERKELNEKVSLWQGDITTLNVDVIVNAANAQLESGGGVCDAIHAKAGPELQQECREKYPNGCETGQSVWTRGYNLPSKYTIHTVGPTDKDSTKLSSCYKTSLDCLLKNDWKSIAFPCISTGINGFSKEEASHVALYQVREFLNQHHEKVERVIFCVYEDQDRRIYETLMQRYFPM